MTQQANSRDTRAEWGHTSLNLEGANVEVAPVAGIGGRFPPTR